MTSFGREVTMFQTNEAAPTARPRIPSQSGLLAVEPMAT
jgi:hypothetical protein